MNLIPLKALLHSSTRRDIRVAVTSVVEIRDTGGERKLVEGDAKKHDNTITSRRSPLTRWIYRQVTGEQLTPNFWRVVSPPSPPSRIFESPLFVALFATLAKFTPLPTVYLFAIIASRPRWKFVELRIFSFLRGGSVFFAFLYEWVLSRSLEETSFERKVMRQFVIWVKKGLGSLERD